ncbi:CD74 molecule, major histocompatibility complex, class II invariant chain a [Alosa pseudoharengus]|uniref:CD74 molecule, major histocompatibility complex, class II invariant chain a n=1 Tax=Alosa pseudoharengus TaxID=34774 RepID=UPI003F8A7225
MADNSSQNEVLIEGAPNAMPAPRRASSGNLKVAGLTLLACLLLAGQAVTTYVLLSQGQHLTALEEGTDTLRRQLGQRSTVSGGAARVMQVPLSMPLLKDFSEADDKAPQPRRLPLTRLQSAIKSDTGTTPVAAVLLDTKCALKAVGRVHPGFYKPQCDEQGNYKPLQCWSSTGYCWCVDKDGTEVTGTRHRGEPRPTCQ